MKTMKEAASERGETLLELLVTVVIMGIALVAIVGGLVVSIHVSDIHRKQATAGAWARSSAEAIEVAVASWAKISYFPTCGDEATFQAVPVPDFPETEYDRIVEAETCPTDGLQQLKITVSSSDGRAAESVRLMVRKAG